MIYKRKEKITKNGDMRFPPNSHEMLYLSWVNNEKYIIFLHHSLLEINYWKIVLLVQNANY